VRIISWIFTWAAIIALGACFYDEVFLFAAGPLAILAVWTDSIACDIELQNFSSRSKKK